MFDLFKLLHSALGAVLVLIVALSFVVLLAALGPALLPLVAVAVLVFIAIAMWPRDRR